MQDERGASLRRREARTARLGRLTVICSGCGCSFAASLAPGLICDPCWSRATMSRAAAAIPKQGRRAGIARPLKQMTSYRNRPVAIPRAYLLELDEGATPPLTRR